MSKVADVPDQEVELEAQIEDRHLQPDLCTIYHPHDGPEKMGTWITAEEGSFTDLDSVR